MKTLVRKGLIDKVVDFKEVQDNLDEESISYHCDVARGDKRAARRQAHNMAQHLIKLTRHMSHGNLNLSQKF